MSILNEQYIQHNVKNATDATAQIIFTAPRDLSVRRVQYRYRRSSVSGILLIMKIADGESVILNRPTYLDESAPIYDFAGGSAPGGVGLFDASRAALVYHIPFPDYLYDAKVRGVPVYAANWPEDPFIRYDTRLPRGYSLGLYFAGNLTGLEDLDITVTLLPAS